MPTFQFRLATLLRLREARRNDRRTRLTEAERAVSLVSQRIAQIDDEVVGLQVRSRAAAQPGRIDVDLLADAQRYEMILKLERSSADQQRQVVTAEVQKRRDELVVADRDVKVLEKLRQAQQTRHREEQARQEVKTFDELALLRHRAGEES